MGSKRKRDSDQVNSISDHKRDDEVTEIVQIDAADLTFQDESESTKEIDRLRVLTGSLDAVLGGYDFYLSPFKVEQVYHESAHIMAMTAIAHGGRYLATGSKDEKIWLWDLKKRLTLGELFEHQADITWLGFHGKYLISCDAAGVIMITRTKDWEPVARMKAKDRINHFSLHPSGRIALSVGADRRLYLWNMMTGRKASVSKIYEEGLSVSWNSSGEEYTVMFERKLVTYGMDARTKHEISLRTRLHCIKYVIYQGLEHIVAACEDGTMRFIREGEEVKCVNAHTARIKAISTYGNYIVSASSDGLIRIYDYSKDAFIGQYQTSDRLTLVLAADPTIEQRVPIPTGNGQVENDGIKTEDEEDD